MIGVYFTDHATPEDREAVVAAFESLRAAKGEIDAPYLAGPEQHSEWQGRGVEMTRQYAESLISHSAARRKMLLQALSGSYRAVPDGNECRLFKDSTHVATLVVAAKPLFAPQRVEVPHGGGLYPIRICRSIFSIKSIDSEKNEVDKHCVQDHFGVLTRRFAYCVRPPDGSDLHRPLAKWAPNGSGLWKEDDGLSLSGELKRRVQAWLAKPDSPPAEDVLKIVVWLHQERGGNLGVCLSSTPKRVRDNQGKAFANAVGDSLWVVDLAKVPWIVVNLYKLKSPLGIASSDNDDAWWAKHMTNSATKNRELWTRQVPANACRQVRLSQSFLDDQAFDWKKDESIRAAIQGLCQWDAHLQKKA